MNLITTTPSLTHSNRASLTHEYHHRRHLAAHLNSLAYFNECCAVSSGGGDTTTGTANNLRFRQCLNHTNLFNEHHDDCFSGLFTAVSTSGPANTPPTTPTEQSRNVFVTSDAPVTRDTRSNENSVFNNTINNFNNFNNGNLTKSTSSMKGTEQKQII